MDFFLPPKFCNQKHYADEKRTDEPSAFNNATLHHKMCILHKPVYVTPTN